MASRVYQLFVVALWLSSMTWLMVAKVLPPLMGGSPPDYDAALFQPEPGPESWKITWQERSIGFAASRVFPDREGGRELRNAVQFENVPLEALMAQVLGSWTRVFGLAGEADLRISATIGTRLWFDASGTLTGFRTKLILRDSPVLVLVQGKVSGPGKLDGDRACGKYIQRREQSGRACVAPDNRPAPRCVGRGCVHAARQSPRLASRSILDHSSVPTVSSKQPGGDCGRQGGAT